MTEIAFYHLQRQTLDQVLPKLLGKAQDAGLRAVIMTSTDERLKELDKVLWTYDDMSFLPHGHAKTPFPEQQPNYLTVDLANPNAATLLFLTDGIKPESLAGFDRCFDLFDGNDPDMVAAARQRWTAYKDEGHDLTYWQQNDRGGWEKKA